MLSFMDYTDESKSNQMVPYFTGQNDNQVKVVMLTVYIPLAPLPCCHVQMVLVLKKEVVKTNNVEHEDTGKYRQLLVRTLHSCSVKFPDVASTIIPVVS